VDQSKATGVEGSLPLITAGDKERLLTELLKGVSRAFYLTLRVLPKELRGPVGLAYLLARAADTIADTTLLPPQKRLEYLLAFRGQVEGPSNSGTLASIADSLTDMQAIAKERELLQSLPQAFSALEVMPTEDQRRVRSIVVTLTRGMEIDLTTFPAEGLGEVVAFRDAEELDNYTYYVAGCVGDFWTLVTMEYTPSLRHWDAEKMSEIGIQFGKALQMTNVLRDVPKDLRVGRCYIPSDRLRQLGLSPQDMLEPSNSSIARPALVDGLRLTMEHYEAAEEYLLSIPRRQLRLRLAVLWPILIGLGTLDELAKNGDWLDPQHSSKVSRGWVYRMLLLSMLCGRSNGILRMWIKRLRKRVEKAL